MPTAVYSFIDPETISAANADNKGKPMSKWRVVSRGEDASHLAMDAVAFGIDRLFGGRNYIYEIKNDGTGERKRVRASGSYSLGEAISEGDFEED